METGLIQHNYLHFIGHNMINVLLLCIVINSSFILDLIFLLLLLFLLLRSHSTFPRPLLARSLHSFTIILFFFFFLMCFLFSYFFIVGKLVASIKLDT